MRLQIAIMIPLAVLILGAAAAVWLASSEWLVSDTRSNSTISSSGDEDAIARWTLSRTSDERVPPAAAQALPQSQE
jgi:hypothetical protein